MIKIKIKNQGRLVLDTPIVGKSRSGDIGVLVDTVLEAGLDPEKDYQVNVNVLEMNPSVDSIGE